jgi:hypothetical protein
MYRIYLKAILVVMVAVAGLSTDGKSQVKRGKAGEICPDQKVYTGKYRNRYYGFSIVIPAGLKGYWNSARCAKTDEGCVCMTDHGRIIPLADDAQIEAYTGYQMEPEWSVSDYEKDEIADLKKQEGVEQVKVLSSKGVRLGGLKARRFAVQYIEKGKNMISDRVVALHKGVEYELILHTLDKRYEEDRREFEKVIASWRLIPRIE